MHLDREGAHPGQQWPLYEYPLVASSTIVRHGDQLYAGGAATHHAQALVAHVTAYQAGDARENWWIGDVESLPATVYPDWDLIYNQGRQAGYKEGHGVGYEIGRQVGYREGYKVGYDEASDQPLHREKAQKTVSQSPPGVPEYQWKSAGVGRNGPACLDCGERLGPKEHCCVDCTYSTSETLLADDPPELHLARGVGVD